MKRRDLFKLTAPAAAALAIPALNADIPPVNKADSHVDPYSEIEAYPRFRIRWRGWFRPENRDILLGQWIAYNPHIEEGYGMNVYSAYPGGCRMFFADQIFDTSVYEDQQTPNLKSTPEDLARFKEQAKDRLTKFIDEHYEELVDI